MNLYHTGLSELYKEIETLGDPLTGISDLIDFERIRPILSDLFTNDTDKGERPNYDPILMVKILLLQQWYNLSDPHVEREIRDRMSFMKFPRFPEKLPCRQYGISGRDCQRLGRTRESGIAGGVRISNDTE